MIPTTRHSGKGKLKGGEKIRGCQALGGGRDQYSEHRGLQGSETTLYDIIRVNTHHYTFIQTQNVQNQE